MLTPQFKLSQDENHVFITIHAPYTNIGETEITVDGQNFSFESSPYSLQIYFPGSMVKNDRSKCSYTFDSGDYSLMFEKETPGENFKNLDMITDVLCPYDTNIIGLKWFMNLGKDDIAIESGSSSSVYKEVKHFYGFANKLSTKFEDIACKFPLIFDFKSPERVSVDVRNEIRQKQEKKMFSSDYYLAYFFDKELIAPYLSSIMVWDDPNFDKNVDFTEQEISILKELSKKHQILTKAEQRQVFLGLIDILFGYCFDKRTTLNQSFEESCWTINKLSPTLCWFVSFKDMKEVLIACYRRALTVPLLRNFELCQKVKSDLVSLLRKGKKYIIKCMLNIYEMFNLSNEDRYILNDLYIKNYLIFLQKCKLEEFDELCNNLANTDMKKKDINLELEELEEEAARMVQLEETQVMENEMAVKMASM